MEISGIIVEITIVFGAGFLIATMLNTFLSPEVLYTASLQSKVVMYVVCPVVAVAILFICFRTELVQNSMDRYAKAKVLLLGAGIASLMSAIQPVYGLFASLLDLYQEWGVGTFPLAQLHNTPLLLFRLFRSIFLATLFGTIERITGFLEERQQTKPK